MTEEKTSFMCYIRTTLHVMFGMVLCKRNVSDLAVHPLNGSDITRNYIFLQTMPDVFLTPMCTNLVRANDTRSKGVSVARFNKHTQDELDLSLCTCFLSERKFYERPVEHKENFR